MCLCLDVCIYVRMCVFVCVRVCRFVDSVCAGNITAPKIPALSAGGSMYVRVRVVYEMLRVQPCRFPRRPHS